MLWLIAALAFIALTIFKLPFPFIILVAGFIRYYAGCVMPHGFEAGKAHVASWGTSHPALINEDTPIPSHAVFSWSRLFRTAVAGIVIWLFATGSLSYSYGWNGTLTQMSWFFTKAALLTFGGAYAILPYVYVGAVEHYLWLTPG